jgi:hypothetical protein
LAKWEQTPIDELQVAVTGFLNHFKVRGERYRYPIGHGQNGSSTNLKHAFLDASRELGGTSFALKIRVPINMWMDLMPVTQLLSTEQVRAVIATAELGGHNKNSAWEQALSMNSTLRYILNRPSRDGSSTAPEFRSNFLSSLFVHQGCVLIFTQNQNHCDYCFRPYWQQNFQPLWTFCLALYTHDFVCWRMMSAVAS